MKPTLLLALLSSFAYLVATAPLPDVDGCLETRGRRMAGSRGTYKRTPIPNPIVNLDTDGREGLSELEDRDRRMAGSRGTYKRGQYSAYEGHGVKTTSD